MPRRTLLIAFLVFLVAGQALTAQRGGRPGAGGQAAAAAEPSAPEVPIMGLAGITFRVSDLAGLRLVRVAPGVAIQLTDGPGNQFEGEQPHLMISVAAGGPAQPSDRDSFARLALGGLPPFKDVRISTSEPMRINGQPGHEMRAAAKDPRTGAEIEIVQWLRFGTGAYLRIIGFAPKEGWTQTYTRFRAVRDGLEPR